MENNLNNSSETGNSEPISENISVGSKKRSLKKTILISIVVIIALLVTFYIIGKQKVGNYMVIEPRELTIDMNDSVQIKVYLQGSSSDNRKDITDKVEWYSNDLDLFIIGNESAKGHVVAKAKGGEGFITLIYRDQTEIIPVTVSKAGLSVECYPLLAGKWTKEGIETAKVGDKIDWMALYLEIGSPHYDYQWTGTGGLESDSAIASIVYNTPGVKEVHFWTKDTAGTTTEANCSIVIE
ncbi:MAG: hypothetical protein U9P50_02475 [Patescibacteria group bacterium]|nr:hypothetical protein [Patescibacteria group bacterium]